MIKEIFKMSWRNIIGNKFSSFLTILGVLIGVTAIISLITIMEGAINESNSQFEELGAGKLSISIPGSVLKKGLTEKDISDLAKIDNVDKVLPSTSTTLSIAANSQMVDNISVEGKNEGYFESNKDSITRGRGLNLLDIESKNNVCVINKKLEEKVFVGKSALGETIRIDGLSYSIVGVMDTGADDPFVAMMTGDIDGKVIIPYKQALKLSNTKYINSLEVLVEDTSKTNSTVTTVEGFLKQRFNGNEDAYRVINLDSILEVMDTMQSMMKGILVAIASISLLVGGVGITNTMTINVKNRTIEIGLRNALGCKPKYIQLQFIIEAVMLSLLGGIIGVILGISLSLIGFDLLNITPMLSFEAISIGLGFSVLVGVIFGWLPAKNASELNPIDALRSL